MNEKLETLFTDLGMEVHDNFAYGIVKNYETNGVVRYFDNLAPFVLHITFYATDDQRKEIETRIKQSDFKSCKFRFTAYGLVIGFNAATVKKLTERMPNYLDTLYDILQACGAKGQNFCPLCGKETDPFSLRHCNFNGFTISVDESCLQELNRTVTEENEQFSNAPNNYLKGFCGALLGVLCGAILNVIIGSFGYIAAITCFLGVLLATKLYVKFGGKQDGVMIVIISVTSLVIMTFSVLITFFVIAFLAGMEAGVMLDPLSAFVLCMQTDQFVRLFYIQLALSVILNIVAIIIFMRPVMKAIKRPKTV